MNISTRVRGHRALAFAGFLAASLLGGCADQPRAHIDNPAIIQSSTPYLNFEVADQETRNYCDWNHQLASEIAENSEGRAVVDDVAFAQPGGRKLTITIVSLHAIGGAGFTGPKWAVVQGRLTQDDRVIGTFERGRNTIGGSFSACKTMRNLGEELADDVAEWLEHPNVDPAVN